MALLSVQDINVYYGAIHAIKGVSFEVEKGEIVTLIGANGAGKSTTLKTISGLLRTKTGSITFQDENIGAVPAHKLIAKGLAQVPEGRAVFLNMTVEENLEMGAFTQPKDKVDDHLQRVYDLFPRLKERQRQIAGTLSGGEQQMLAMGRALMSDPTLMMLDEPSMGLAPCTKTAPLSSWWSRTPRWPSAWPTGAMCWRPARSSPAAPAPSSSTTRA